VRSDGEYRIRTLVRQWSVVRRLFRASETCYPAELVLRTMVAAGRSFAPLRGTHDDGAGAVLDRGAAVPDD
jgi:hypothetical protein